MKSDHPVVGIFGHYGNRNLGDESIIKASINHVRKRLPNVEVVCFSLRPGDSSRRHQVEAYSIRHCTEPGPIQPVDAPAIETMPWRVHAEQLASGINPDEYSENTQRVGIKERIKRLPLLGPALVSLSRTLDLRKTIITEIGYLYRSYHYLKKFDLLVFSGSNQFLDIFGGPWGAPYTLLKWTILAKLSGTKTAFLSIGANPLEPLSKKMLDKALNMANYLSYRDAASKALMEEGNPGYSGHIYPDLAFGLEFTPVPTKPLGDKPLIAINPMPVYDYRYWSLSDEPQYRTYVGKLARIAERLISEGYPILFFGTMWRDDYVIVDVFKAMKPEILRQIDQNDLVRQCEELSDLISLLQEVDVVVSTRFHATLLPLLVNTPVIGISYYRKNVDLMESFKQQEYTEVLEHCDAERLWQKIQLLTKNYMQEKVAIKLQTERNRLLVDEQWDRVLSLI